jgi:2,3-bisphosphoglycerate-dependent phosphoglycerate mutase
MTEIILVRHASSTHQATDAPLTAAGAAQSVMLAELLSTLEVTRIVSSPYRRAVQTVEPFSAQSGLAIELDARLGEHRLSGLELADWGEHLRASFDDLDRCLNGGESSRAARERALAAVEEAAATGQRTLLSTHGKLLALLLSAFDASVGYDVWQKLSNPDVYVLNPRAGSFRRLWKT